MFLLNDDDGVKVLLPNVHETLPRDVNVQHGCARGGAQLLQHESLHQLGVSFLPMSSRFVHDVHAILDDSFPLHHSTLHVLIPFDALKFQLAHELALKQCDHGAPRAIEQQLPLIRYQTFSSIYNLIIFNIYLKRL